MDKAHHRRFFSNIVECFQPMYTENVKRVSSYRSTEISPDAEGCIPAIKRSSSELCIAYWNIFAGHFLQMIISMISMITHDT